MLQRVFDELASTGGLTSAALARFPDLDLDSAALLGVRDVNDGWLDGLKHCQRLRSLDLSRCTLVSSSKS